MPLLSSSRNLVSSAFHFAVPISTFPGSAIGAGAGAAGTEGGTTENWITPVCRALLGLLRLVILNRNDRAKRNKNHTANSPEPP